MNIVLYKIKVLRRTSPAHLRHKHFVENNCIEVIGYLKYLETIYYIW